MTDVQIPAIAIALSTSFLAVLIGVLLNNSRLNDVKELLAAKIDRNRAEITGTKDALVAKIDKSHADLFVLIERTTPKCFSS